MVHGPNNSGWLKPAGRVASGAPPGSVYALHITKSKTELFSMSKSPPPRQTSSKVSTLASNVLAGRVTPSKAQINTLAASALGQDQTKGQAPKKR